MKLSYGIDVSAFQSVSDWHQVARVCQFVIVKATEGHSYVSSAFGRYSAAARAAGLVVGSYHVAKPPGSAAAEARWYVQQLRAAGWRNGHDLPPVLDIEGSSGMSRAALTAWSRAFVTEVDAQLGLTSLPPIRRCGFYIGGSLAQVVDVASIVRDRWYWGTPPGYYLPPHWPSVVPAGQTIHQFTDRGIGVVPGITGRGLDLNIATDAALRALAPNHFAAPATKPPEVPTMAGITADQLRAIVRDVIREETTVTTSERQRHDYGYAHERYRLTSIANDASWHARRACQLIGQLAEATGHATIARAAAVVDVDQDQGDQQ